MKLSPSYIEFIEPSTPNHLPLHNKNLSIFLGSSNQIMENDHHISSSLEDKMSEWEHVHSPFSTNKSHLINIDDSSSVIIKDDFFGETSAFPPGNHEDLPIGIPQDNNKDDSNDQSLREPKPISSEGVRKSKRVQSGFLKSGILEIVGRVRKYAACRIGLWWFGLGSAAVAAVVLVSLFLRRRIMIWWQRQMQMVNGKESLMLLIKEKDEKINQLLLQIAKLNEALLARRRVPVIRVIAEDSLQSSL